MTNLKKYLCLLPAMSVFIWMAFSSCNNTPDAADVSQRTTLAQPVTKHLRMSAAQKMDLNAVKSVAVRPDVRRFDLDKLPLRHYDTGAFKMAKYHPQIKKFDMKELPSRPLDVDKLPSFPLKFKLYKLHAPKLIKAGARRVVNNQAAVFELGEAQGLKADSISVTYTDRDGFIWIGTNRGLYRYDGENFWFFSDLPQKQTPLCIVQDKQGLLWIGTLVGSLEVIDIKNGVAKTIDTKNKTALLDVNRIIIDDKQRLWTASWSGGASIIDLVHQTIRYLGKHEGITSNEIPAIGLDSNKNIWIGSVKGGLNYIDLKNKMIKYVDSLHGLTTDRMRTILFDRKGRLWAGQYNGTINIFNFEQASVQTISEVQGVFNATFNLIFTMVQDRQGRIWVGRMGNGIEVIDPENQTRAYLKNSAELSSQYIVNLNLDNREQIWVAGLMKLNVMETNKFTLDQIGDKSTTSMWEDYNGLIWRAGDFDGVEIIDRKRKTIRRLDATNGLAKDTMGFLKEHKGKMLITDNANLYVIDSTRRTMTTMGKKQGFFSPYRSWAFDDKGRMWMGGFNFGLAVYNTANNTIKLLGKKEGIRDGDIEDMCTDPAGNIWISTENAGIGVINPDAGTVRYIDNAELKDAEQRILLPDSAGNVWATDSKGVFKINLLNQTLTWFGKRQGLTDKAANVLLLHGEQIYSANLKGLSIITPPPATGKNKNWKVEPLGSFFGFGRKNGDPQSDAISRDGVYWMGDMGVTAFDLNARDTVNHPAYITGIKIMDSARYFTGDLPAKAGGLNWERTIGLSNMPANLHIPYDQNFMQFNFGVLNLARHDTVYYKYQLLGIDKDWSKITDETFTHNYINLAPGKYVFEVSSLGYNKAWTKPAIVSFTIDPPWWQTWWAYVLYVALIAGSIWGFSHYRSLQLIKDKRVLEHKVYLRTQEVLQQKEEIESQRDDLDKAFKELTETQSQLVQREKMASLGELTAGIAHEIQNPLNFVNNFSEVSIELIHELDDELNKGDITEARAIGADLVQNLEKINHHGKRAEGIVKGMLEHSRINSAQKEITHINALADEYLRLAYHGLRAKDKDFNAELATHFDNQLPKVNVIPQDLGRVFLNLFNNAFYAVNQKKKTAGAGYRPEVSVSTSTENGKVIIKVNDNGTGIPEHVKDKIMQPFFTTKPTGEGTGLGLSLSYDMVVKGHGGNINVNSTEGEGSEFIITLPVN